MQNKNALNRQKIVKTTKNAKIKPTKTVGFLPSRK